MYTTQVILLSGKGKISVAIADSLPKHLHVHQVFISENIFFEAIHKEQAHLSNADLAILNLSEMDGQSEQILSGFTALYPKLPIIAMHLYNQKVFAEAFLSMGAKAYLPINFYTEDLLSAIDHVLDQKKFIAKNVY